VGPIAAEKLRRVAEILLWRADMTGADCEVLAREIESIVDDALRDEEISGVRDLWGERKEP
jgi:hypothetical protein